MTISDLVSRVFDPPHATIAVARVLCVAGLLILSGRYAPRPRPFAPLCSTPSGTLLIAQALR